MTKRVGIKNYKDRLAKIRELNLTSDLFSSIVFEDHLAVQDVLRILQESLICGCCARNPNEVTGIYMVIARYLMSGQRTLKRDSIILNFR